jgi:two-component system, NarL family, invasion response regulator UvrY
VNDRSIDIMLVDDHAIVRSGFRRLLEQQPNLRVVAEASGAERAYALFCEFLPHVIVMDLSMPGVSGFEIIRRILHKEPDANIVIFSMHDDASIAERALALGARGYVTKSNAPEVLVSAIIDVVAGKTALSPDIAKSLALSKLAGDESPLSVLSAREFEIFRLLASGKIAADIAKLLNLSGKTIANYHTLIKQKLRIGSDIELVLLAQRHNVL